LGWVVLTLLGHVYEALMKDCVWIMQLVFLDKQVDCNWWVVFLPTWVVMFGQL
ncbi:unnamed protein product, partial [Ascophyllum nodosum]